MLVFFIHGVNTQNYKYADSLIKNIKKNIKISANFYSGFWGNLFNDKKHQVIGFIEKDFQELAKLIRNIKGITMMFIDIRQEEMN